MDVGVSHHLFKHAATGACGHLDKTRRVARSAALSWTNTLTNPRLLRHSSHPRGYPRTALATSIVSHLTISAVERDTGLTKDVLRVWERRYGFPAPLRDGNGERLYPPSQVERLRTIRRLMDAGHRPGRLLTLTDAELLSLSRRRSAHVAGASDGAANTLTAGGARVAALLGSAMDGEAERMEQAMNAALLQHGLPGLIAAVVLPLMEQIDDARLRGEISPCTERLCREQIRRVLQSARNLVAATPPPDASSGQPPPPALLATLPHDSDDLPLLAAEALLLGEGMRCLSLGVQVPVADIAAAAGQWRVAVVVPSFAASLSPKTAIASLEALRDALPPATPMWVIGELIPRLRREPAGVTLFTAVADIAQHARSWLVSTGKGTV